MVRTILSVTLLAIATTFCSGQDAMAADLEFDKRSFSARLPPVGLRNRGYTQDQVKKSDTLLRFGRAQQQIVDFDDDEANGEDMVREERSGGGATLLRFGRAPLLRYGKRASPLLRFGKRAPLLRFGKRPDTLLRFGRSAVRMNRRYEKPDVTLRFG